MASILVSNAAIDLVVGVSKFCKTHTSVEMTVGTCGRCDGDGYTESDLEDIGDPTKWHDKGTCYQCGGTGHGFLECDVCEREYQEEQLMEEDQ